MERFNPMGVLEFVVAIFMPQSSMQKTGISFETVSVDAFRKAIKNKFDKSLLLSVALPETLVGDQLRLK